MLCQNNTFYRDLANFYPKRIPDLPEIRSWVNNLYNTTNLPDKRLNERLRKIVAAIATKPADSLPQTFTWWKDIKGAYRFIENERVIVNDLIKPLVDSTVQACKKEKVILEIQDTTEFSFPNATQTTGLGYANQNDCPSLFMHSSLAIREDGVPLGLLYVKFWSRPFEERGKKKKPVPIEQRESYRWIEGVRASHKAMMTLDKEQRSHLIHVGDREEDIHEVFAEIIKNGDGAVIRSAQNRSVRTEQGAMGLAFNLISQKKALAKVVIDVPRKHGQRARRAHVKIRAYPFIVTPSDPKNRKRKSVRLTLIEVKETGAPEDVEPLHWLLWTNEEAKTKTQILRIIEIYKKRWRIEDFHLVLKSGCRIEELQMKTAERIEKTISLYAPVAIRILMLRDLSRIEPESPCTLVLKSSEWKALWTFIHGNPPDQNTVPPSIKQATLWIGKLGGHIGRKSDGMPGVRTLWRGLRDLELLSRMFEFFQS